MIPQRWSGFQSRYFLSPLFRKLFLNRSLSDEELTYNKDRSPANHSPPNPPKENEQHDQKLNDLVEQSRNPLFTFQTAIPLNPFPDKVTIDINKVNIIYRYFFSSEHIHSVSIKDISDVLVETSWFFSTLKIIDVGFTENSIDVNYLKTNEAVKARKIIQGLIVANKSGVDLSKCDISDLIEKLEELGKAE